MDLREIFVAVAVGTLLATVGVAQTAGAGDNTGGARLYETCAQCHGEKAQGSHLAFAPSIAGLKDWYVLRQLQNFRSGVRGLHPDDTNGLRMYPLSRVLKSDEEVAAVAAYVASLRPVRATATAEGGDAVKGAKYYETCAACHGKKGDGNEQMNAPRLVNTSDWYLVSSLQNFRAGVRGWSSNNSNARMMRAMSAQLPDEQAIKDVVAYILTLQ